MYTHVYISPIFNKQNARGLKNVGEEEEAKRRKKEKVGR